MTPLQIDFAGRSVRHALRRSGLLSAVVACAAAVACVVAALTGAQVVQQREAVDAAIATTMSRIAARGVPARSPDSGVTAQQADAVNLAVAQLNLPWLDLFKAIENATSQDIALLELNPDVRKGIVKGTAEARNNNDMLDYVARLGNERFFDSVVLTRHEINQLDPNRPLRFQFVAQWQRGKP